MKFNDRTNQMKIRFNNKKRNQNFELFSKIKKRFIFFGI